MNSIKTTILFNVFLKLFLSCSSHTQTPSDYKLHKIFICSSRIAMIRANCTQTSEIKFQKENKTANAVRVAHREYFYVNSKTGNWQQRQHLAKWKYGEESVKHE